MNIKQLREALEQYPDDMEVVMSDSDYGYVDFELQATNCGLVGPSYPFRAITKETLVIGY